MRLADALLAALQAKAVAGPPSSARWVERPALAGTTHWLFAKAAEVRNVNGMGRRTWTQGWPVFRQLTGTDPLGRGAAAMSAHSAALTARTETADRRRAGHLT
jgi:hypothetical protein